MSDNDGAFSDPKGVLTFPDAARTCGFTPVGLGVGTRDFTWTAALDAALAAPFTTGSAFCSTLALALPGRPGRLGSLGIDGRSILGTSGSLKFGIFGICNMSGPAEAARDTAQSTVPDTKFTAGTATGAAIIAGCDLEQRGADIFTGSNQEGESESEREKM